MTSFDRLSRFALLAVSSAVLGYIVATWIQTWRQDGAISDHAEEIYRSPESFVAGNPSGDVSVVAFFDYNCPYCRQDAAALDKLIAEDGQIRLVLKELPVLGPDSEEAARIAQAAMAQGRYFELYQKLIAGPGRITKDRALRIASELGLDTAKLEQDARSPAVERAIAANAALAKGLGVKGVPFYLVGDRPVTAGDGLHDRLTAGVADIRETGCRAAC